MSDPTSLSDQLSDAEWLSELAEIGRSRGYFRRLGLRHNAIHIAGSDDVLVVGFDTIATARSGSASGIPHGMLLSEVHGWSHLSLLAHEPTWFRDEQVQHFVDRLTDQGFFESYERVIFYGVGSNGYAAAAYSVAAPGATVILTSPQATLDPNIAPWDDRFSRYRRVDFRRRYGYAPDMIDAADRVVLFYDPFEDLDAMHAALFRGPQVLKIRVRHGGAGLGRLLQEMNVISQVVTAAGHGYLTETHIYRALQRRRRHLPYLRNLLNRLHVEERHMLVGLLCRYVTTDRNAPRFRHHLELAESKLVEAGRTLPPAHNKTGSADQVPGSSRT
ncbi:MAG: phosphoadenosine phosphosulfate reductase [Pseudomonadota bacterium]